MDKPRIFLGSSGKQAKLLQALTRGLEDIAHVEPWTTSFNPGTTTLERLLELTREVDFAAFVFARDDWTTVSRPASDPSGSGQASPRDNVVFEAGLFGGVLGMRRTFILHASGAKLPSDLLGLTCIRYEDTTAAEMRVVNEKLRKAIENETTRRPHRGPVVAIFFDRTQRRGAVGGEPLADLARARRSAGAGGPLMARGRHTVSALLERSGEGEKGSFGRLLQLERRTARHPNAPQLEGTGEIRLESAERAAGYFTTRSDTHPQVNARTSGVYVRADPKDLSTLDGVDDRQRAELIDERLTDWKSRRTNA